MVPEIEEMFTILRNTSLPSPISALAASLQVGAIARISRKGTTVWMSSIAWNCSSVIRCTTPSHVYPALLTRMSTLPNSSRAFFTSSSGTPGLVRSPANTAVSPSISDPACSATSPSMSLISTCAPSLTKSSAVARPIPRAEPVMIALLPSSSPI